jgi:hypothetical protein
MTLPRAQASQLSLHRNHLTNKETEQYLRSVAGPDPWGERFSETTLPSRSGEPAPGARPGS